MSKHDDMMKFWRERQREIVRLYDSNKYSLAEIGEIYGITAERIRQIYKRAKQL